jgi:sodium-dependent dicarboxylate transporter 2/3/5
MPMLGITTMANAMSNFIIPTVLFIMSTFIIAAAFIDTGFGTRVSLFVSTLFGNKPDRVLLSYMLPTAVVSTVLLDIPTAIIFGGVAYTLLKKNECMPGKSNFGKALMVGIPTAAAIGGIGTPAGSGMNTLAISLLKNSAGIEINFLQWTIIGFPMAIILCLVAWLIIRTMIPSELEYVKGLEDIKNELKALGSLNAGEKKFLVIFLIELVLWLTEPLHHVAPAVVAIIAAALFFFPGIDLIDWDRAKGMINWELLLLVGGSNSLAVAIGATGSAVWLANTALGGLVGQDLFVLILAVAAFGVFSHLLVPVGSAVLVVSVPVVAVLAQQVGIHPGLLVLPIAFTASDVMIMPLDPIPLTTYNYKFWKMGDMMKPGFVISLAWIVLCVAFMYMAQGLGIV